MPENQGKSASLNYHLNYNEMNTMYVFLKTLPLQKN
jgi:hypothetical protein